MTFTAVRPTATGVPGYSNTVLREASAVRTARQLVRAALSVWNLGGDLESGAVLIMSELATNVVQHAEGRWMRVSVTRPGVNCVRVAVSDRSRLPLAFHAPETDAVGGRGLLLVEATANRWGVDYRRWGKVVWADLVEVNS
jgi:anti-sigma regulatory factor (Ser/Thr protein kinase)